MDQLMMNYHHYHHYLYHLYHAPSRRRRHDGLESKQLQRLSHQMQRFGNFSNDLQYSI
jgi:hypothetical protein